MTSLPSFFTWKVRLPLGAVAEETLHSLEVLLTWMGPSAEAADGFALSVQPLRTSGTAAAAPITASVLR